MRRNTLQRLLILSSLTFVWSSCFFSAANASVELYLTEGKTRILLACPSNQYAIDRISPEMDWEGFYERDIELVTVSEKFPHVYLTYSVDGYVHRDPLNGKYVEKVVERSKCDEQTSFVLIGKDGGVKRRWSGKFPVHELFQTIDAMPMRQYEMRTRGGN